MVTSATGAVARRHGATPLDQVPDAVAFFVQFFAQAAMLFRERDGNDILARLDVVVQNTSR